MATAAAIPSLGPAGQTSLKAPATSSTTAESATAGKSQVSSGSSTPQAMPRRPARPVSTDYLSDKATTAFIRRTLCAQHLAERGRNTPAPIEELLPPLTSRNDVDLQLYALLSVILKEFVQKWYSNITPDETFVAEIVQIIAHCTRALEQRLRNMDLESLLLDELPELLDAHVRAYRTAQNSAARPPIMANHQEIYHSLCPLPALSPLPKPGDTRSLQAQADSEAAYRQLLVQGVLALLLPTEDLENECLTSLVGQIFSELIIGNLVAKKLSEPWLLLEIFIMLTRLAKGNSQPTSSSEIHDSTGSNNHGTDPTRTQPTKTVQGSSFHESFWSLVQWGFLLVGAIRVLIGTLVLSRSLPPRSALLFAQKPYVTDHSTSEESHRPLTGSRPHLVPTRVPISNFKIWPCIANLLEMDARMPWLSGALSMIQWSATRGPGHVAGYNGIVDRLLSHYIQSGLLDPSRLPPLLRSIRSALFPNNAPGTSTLVAPSSEEELVALRRRCASAIWTVVPKSIGRLYFGSVPFWPSSKRSSRITLEDDSSMKTLRSGPQDSKSSRSAPRGYSASDKSPAAGEPKDTQESGAERFTEGGKPKGHSSVASDEPPGRDVVEQDGSIGYTQPSPSELSTDQDEDRILAEIEAGILDVFSDAYCNKHLVYGMLELILVRIMPELAEKGIIELWEERLS